jgi:hypothetical protein
MTRDPEVTPGRAFKAVRSWAGATRGRPLPWLDFTFFYLDCYSTIAVTGSGRVLALIAQLPPASMLS